MVPVQALLTSLVLIIGLLAVRQGLLRAIRRKSEVLSKDQRLWISRVKNSVLILIIIGLVLIWAPQLRSLALSLAAVAVALVVATKEMILCLTGALMRVSTTPFRIGDWITIGGISGEVVDINAWGFRIEEVDVSGKTYRPTGRVVVIPNSKLFTDNIENLTFVKKYVFVDVPVSVPFADFTAGLSDRIEEIAEARYAPFLEGARKYNRSFEKKTGMDIPDPDPVVSLRASEGGNITYTVRAFVPTGQASAFYKQVVSDILDTLHAAKARTKASQAPKSSRKQTQKQTQKEAVTS